MNSLVVLFLVLLLIAIRTFESVLFYDPFLLFFKSEYQNLVLPEFEFYKLFFGILFRYLLNGVISILIIYYLFKNKQLVKLSIGLYVLLFLILGISFFSILYFSIQPNYLILFYIRRFLIQPLFLVLFIPAFYYQKNKIND